MSQEACPSFSGFQSEIFGECPCDIPKQKEVEGEILILGQNHVSYFQCTANTEGGGHPDMG